MQEQSRQPGENKGQPSSRAGLAPFGVKQSRQFIASKTTGKSECRFPLLAHGQDGHAAESENQEQVHA